MMKRTGFFRAFSEWTSRMRKFNALVISAFLILAATFENAHANVYNHVYHWKVSWYGRAKDVLTATGKVLNHDEFFAASRTLPFGTKLIITNPLNNRTIVVTVMDRGPYVYSRKLDLSYGAAKALGMIRRGVIQADVKFYHSSLLKQEALKYQHWLAEKENLKNLFNPNIFPQLVLAKTDTELDFVKMCMLPGTFINFNTV